jgi:hypothetical protein
LPWLEYNIHLCGQPNYENVTAALADLLQPFVDAHRSSFSHWHYLLEPDKCRANSTEIRLRFEGEKENLAQIRQDLLNEIRYYGAKTHLVMRDDVQLGSHEGCHGNRVACYQGAASEGFGRDWQSIVEILQIGSESAIQILKLGRGLVAIRSLQLYQRQVQHPYFLHLPANQLIVEP